MPDDRFLRANPNPLPLDVLKHPDFDVREYRTDEDIENIRKSLEAKGQIMPILVGEKENGQHPILDGNHRYLAAKRAGWPTIDAIQTRAGVDSDEAQIVANISRLELAPSEKLATFDYLLNVLDLNHTEAAEKVGFDRSQVHRYAKILAGYGEIKEYFMQGELGVHAAYELNLVDDRDRAVDIAETAVREGYKDADVIQQAKFARAEDGAEDAMRGAGTQENVENMQRVKKNVQAMNDLDPIDEQAARDAQVAPDADQPPAEGQAPDSPDVQREGPPCAGCGQPLPQEHLSLVKFHPALAEQLGIQSLKFGEDCTKALVDFWVGLQEQAEVEGEPPEAADD